MWPFSTWLVVLLSQPWQDLLARAEPVVDKAGLESKAVPGTDQATNRSSATFLGRLSDKRLEKELREWWGNVRYSEFERLVDDDLRDLGYELGEGAQEQIQMVMRKVLRLHHTGHQCSSLAAELAAHAWRYNQTHLWRCLGQQGHFDSCHVPCIALPGEAAELRCNGSAITGAAPGGKCKWMRDGQVVNTTGGLVRGLVRPIPWKHVDGTVTWEQTRSFWGIPYADRPQRFTYSKPLSRRWSGTHVTDYFDLKKNSSSRMHCAGAAPLDEGGGAEDCLFLDIYVPPNASTLAPRPVVAFFFASGFIYGDAWQDGHTDGSRIAIRDDVVWVGISARAAALGHWAHPALSKESGDGSAGNIGERDQRMALQWIQDNIRAFGGDPSKVTLLGHSSGAFSVAFHLASPGSNGLFAGAVAESATFDSGWYWQAKEDAYAFYSQLGESMGCPADAGNGSQISCLRKLPVGVFFNNSKRQSDLMTKRLQNISRWSLGWDILKTIVSTTIGTSGSFHEADLPATDSRILSTPLWPVLPFGLIVDGAKEGLPAPASQAYAAGGGAKVPVYMNHEHDEGTLFAAALVATFPWQKEPSFTHSSVDAMLHWAFGSNASFSRELIKRYPHGIHLNAPFYRISRAITDAVFLCSARRFAVARSRHAAAGNTYWGEHTFAGGITSRVHSVFTALWKEDLSYFLGAHHGLPSFQIFGTEYSSSSKIMGGPWDELDQKNHELMLCHLALMFHCGDPAAPENSTCRQRMDEQGIMPLGCLSVPEAAVHPFLPFNAERQSRKEISPTSHAEIVPSEEEQELCRFWDAAPPMSLQPNACRGCVQPSPMASGQLVYV